MSKRPLEHFSRQKLTRELEKIAREAPQPKDQIYKYLELVYALRFEWGDHVPKIIELSMKAYRETLHANTDKNYIRIIIDRTCNKELDVGLRSRYANALMYWYERDTKPSEVIELLRSKGGTKTWDKEYRAKLKPQKRKKRRPGARKKRLTPP